MMIKSLILIIQFDENIARIGAEAYPLMISFLDLVNIPYEDANCTIKKIQESKFGTRNNGSYDGVLGYLTRGVSNQVNRGVIN